MVGKTRISAGGAKGFTLVELTLAIALMLIFIPVAYEGYLSMKMRSFEAQVRANTLAGVASLNAEVSLAVRNAYGIDYAGTSASSDGADVLSLFADKQERHKLTLYVERDVASDVSRLMAKYDSDPPKPLHSNLLFLSKFDVSTSPDPRADGTRADDQPWVSMKLSARSRSPLERETDAGVLAAYQKSQESLYGRWTLRNFSPSSLKR